MAGKHVQVVRFIRRLQGSSQPILVEGINGILYVLKFRNNLQGPHVLFNEAAGMQLYRSFDLPVPVWEPLLLSKGFIERNRRCWMEGTDGHIPPDPGLCLGTRFFSPANDVVESLPENSYARLSDQSNFWMAWLIDVCCNHSDDRQALFIKKDDERFKTVFIDFGHFFGGPWGTEHPNPMTCMYIDLGVYPYLSEATLKKFLKMCRGFNPSEVIAHINALPSDWQCAKAFGQLMRGVNRLCDSRFVESLLGRALNSCGSSLGRPPSTESVLYLWRDLLSC